MSGITTDKPGGIDARVLRTRTLLADALMSLGAARGVDDLEVGDIIHEAGVARSTFYAHFAGKDDFLVRSFVNMIAATEKAVRTKFPGRDELLPSLALFTHVHRAGDFARRMAESAIFAAQMTAGEVKLREIAGANLARLRPDWPSDRRCETAVYVAAGFVGLLRWWMRTGLRQSPAQMQAAFERLTRRALED